MKDGSEIQKNVKSIYLAVNCFWGTFAQCSTAVKTRFGFYCNPVHCIASNFGIGTHSLENKSTAYHSQHHLSLFALHTEKLWCSPASFKYGHFVTTFDALIRSTSNALVKRLDVGTSSSWILKRYWNVRWFLQVFIFYPLCKSSVW